MKLIGCLSLAVFSFCVMAGCATTTLSEANNRYNSRSHKTINIQKSSFTANVYEAGATRYYELNVDSKLYYVEAKKNGFMSLVENKPDNSVMIGETTIFIRSKNNFDKKVLTETGIDYPKEIYVVTNNDFDTVSTDTPYTLHYMSKSGPVTHGPVQNHLSPSATQSAISTIRKAGYLVTVPVDVATTPILAGLMLVILSSL